MFSFIVRLFAIGWKNESTFCNVLPQLKRLVFCDCICCAYFWKEEVMDGDVAVNFENLAGKDGGREAGVEWVKTLPCKHCR